MLNLIQEVNRRSGFGTPFENSMLRVKHCILAANYMVFWNSWFDVVFISLEYKLLTKILGFSFENYFSENIIKSWSRDQSESAAN